MAPNTVFKDLPNQILKVSHTTKELSSIEIHERIKKFYPGTSYPTRVTVWRAIQKLINDKEMYEGDSGYLKVEDTKLSLNPFFDSHPLDELKQEIGNLLLIGALNPVDAAGDIKRVVDERLLPLVNRMRVIIDLLDLLSQSPEIVLWMAHNHKLIQDNLREFKNYPDWEETVWNQTNTYGEYVITCSRKETP